MIEAKTFRDNKDEFQNYVTYLTSDNPSKLHGFKEFAFMNAKLTQKMLLKNSFEENYNLLLSTIPESSLKRYLPVNKRQEAKNLHPQINNLKKTHPWVQYNQTVKTFTIPSGKHRLTEKLVIPVGYQLLISEGTEINLEEKGFILSYSPLRAIGSLERPIIFKSKKGKRNGIMIINPFLDDSSPQKNIPQISELAFVQFKGLSAPKEKGWAPTGAVTFYGGKVIISQSKFSDNQSEDSLNIISGQFEIKNTHFSNAFSDALDIDFGVGTLENLSFERIKNDSLDFSGSQVTINQIKINKSKDKGISIGEKSTVTGRNISIDNSAICIADKDGSYADLDQLILSNCKLGIALYQKKPEYGPSTLNFKNLKDEKVEKLFSVEKGFTLLKEGKEIGQRETEVF